jgi:flagellar L-ring protein precursor FlgH
MIRSIRLLALLSAPLLLSAQRTKPTDLERYLERVQPAAASMTPGAPPGAIYAPGARFGMLGVDLRASQVNDLLTVVVQERASAVSKGTLKSTRSSSVKSSIGDLYGPASAALNRLAGLSTNTDLNGEGATTRETTLHTSVTARVVHVMPNGNMVIQANKEVTINAETQSIVLLGIVRPIDVNTANVVFSDRIADMEVRVNGKGVVGSAIRRPFFLYRLLLGILPF